MNAKVETRSVSVGDVMVLVRKSGAKPETVNVARLSKKWFWVVGADGKEVGGFDRVRVMNWSDRETGFLSHERVGAGKYDSLASARIYGLDALEMLTDRYEEFEKVGRKAKADAAEAERAKRREEDARLAETKAAYGGSLFSRVRAMDTMPDGTRIYHLNCVVNPKLTERKKGWEVAIIKCIDREEPDFRATWREGDDDKLVMRKYVESYVTYTNGNESSFPSCSGERHANDEEALWANLTYIYHHW